MGTNWHAAGLPHDLGERHAVYRERILDAAEAEFTRRGFVDVKINRIALEAGVSVATVRRHFTGKMGIWNGMHQHRLEQLLAALKDSGAATAPSAKEQILVAVRAVVHFFVEHDGYLDLHCTSGLSWATADPHQVGLGDQPDGWSAGHLLLRRGVDRAAKEGSVVIDDVDLATAVVLSSVQVWLASWHRSAKRRSASMLADDLCAHLSRSVFSTAGPTGSA